MMWIKLLTLSVDKVLPCDVDKAPYIIWIKFYHVMRIKLLTLSVDRVLSCDVDKAPYIICGQSFTM